MSQGSHDGLVSVVMSAWGSDVSGYVAIANNLLHGSYRACSMDIVILLKSLCRISVRLPEMVTVALVRWFLHTIQHATTAAQVLV